MAATLAPLISPRAAEAVPVNVPLQCRGDAGIFGQHEFDALKPDIDVTAPPSVQPGQPFEERITFQPYAIPGEVEGHRVNHINAVVARFRLSSQAAILGVSLAGGASPGATVSQAGQILTLNAPAQVNGGDTLLLPQIVLSLQASGAAGSTIVTDVPGLSYDDPSLNLFIEVHVSPGINPGLNTSCYSVVPNQQLGTVAISEPVADHQLAVADASVVRPGPDQVARLPFEVTLSKASTEPVTVHYRTVDGTAKAGIDYRAATGVVTVPGGATKVPISVDVFGSRYATADRQLKVQIYDPGHAVVGRGEAVGTIRANAKLSPTEKFVRALSLDFLGHEPSRADLTDLATKLDDHSMTRAELASRRSWSDEWLSSFVTRFYRDTLRRDPDPAGQSYWIDRMRSGFSTARVQAELYGSDEYLTHFANGNLRGWVEDEYLKMLTRRSEPAGLAYWMDAAETKGRPYVSLHFLGCPEARDRRAGALVRYLLRREPTPRERAAYAPQLRKLDDRGLSALIAGSAAYYERAQTR